MATFYPDGRGPIPPCGEARAAWIHSFHTCIRLSCENWKSTNLAVYRCHMDFHLHYDYERAVANCAWILKTHDECLPAHFHWRHTFYLKDYGDLDNMSQVVQRVRHLQQRLHGTQGCLLV